MARRSILIGQRKRVRKQNSEETIKGCKFVRIH